MANRDPMENPMLGQNKVLPVLEEIKRNARIIKKTLGVAHSDALNRAAVLSQFENYRHACNTVKAGKTSLVSLSPPRQFTAKISQFWAADEQRGKETLEVVLSRPLSEITTPQRLKLIRGLSTARQIGENLFEGVYVSRGQLQAQELLYTASRTLTFMDATGLQPSTGWQKAYPRGESKIPGEDHAKIWFEPKTLRYVICDEPYQREFNDELSKRQEWLAKFGYVMATADWLGTYNPYMDEFNGSRLHLISHATKGLDVKLLASILNNLPKPVGRGVWSGISGPSYF
jgi:hypothetical protein